MSSTIIIEKENHPSLEQPHTLHNPDTGYRHSSRYGSLRTTLLLLITVLTVSACSRSSSTPTLAPAYANATRAAESARVATETVLAATEAATTPEPTGTPIPTPSWAIELGKLLSEQGYSSNIRRGDFEITIPVGAIIKSSPTFPNGERCGREHTRKAIGTVRIFLNGEEFGEYAVWESPSLTYVELSDDGTVFVPQE